MRRANNLINIDDVTQYAKETNIDMAYQDGHPAGILTDTTINTSGVITGI